MAGFGAGSGREADGLNAARHAFTQLRHWVRTLPVPTAPPRYPYVGTSVGVGLLDAAINLDHVVRRTEHLRIIDVTHLTRDVTLHLSLDRLTPPQYAAALEYGSRRERSKSRDGLPPFLWVPITRVNRLFASPARILDEEGRVVPRATQPELLPLINAAMYRLLRLVLLGQAESHAGANGGTEDEDRAEPGDSGSLHRLLYEGDRARWLLQQAMASMVYNPHPVEPRDERRGDEDSPHRLDALAVVDGHLTVDRQSAFLELLYHASTEYVVVAALSSVRKEHYLSYDAPALPSRPARRLWLATARRTLRGLSPLGGELTLRYENQLPANLESFQVSVEAEGGGRIREGLLLTSHDQGRAASVVARLGAFGAPMSTLPDAVRHYEVGEALESLAELVDARISDADGYRMQFVQHHARAMPWTARPIPSRELTELSTALGEAGHDELRAGAMRSGVDLAALGRTVGDLGIGRSCATDHDPRGRVSYMMWRRRRPSQRTLAAADAAADVQVVVADEPPALSRSIPAWLTILLALVGVMAGLVFDDAGWLLREDASTGALEWAPRSPLSDGSVVQVERPFRMEADALVAVLLVVPGWLLLQMVERPVRGSVASHLRMLESATSFVAVAATAYLALVIAVRRDDDTMMFRSFYAVFAFVAVLLVLNVVKRASGVWKAKRSRVDLLHVPSWLRARQVRWRHPFRLRVFDVEYESVAHRAANSVILLAAIGHRVMATRRPADRSGPTPEPQPEHGRA